MHVSISLLFSLGDNGSSSGEEGRVGKTSVGKASMSESMVGKASMGNMGKRSRMSKGIEGGSGNMGNMGDSGLVDSDVMLVNDRGLDHMVNGMDLVGLRDGIRLGDLNGIRLGHVFLDDDFPFNGDGDGTGDVDVVFVDLKLGLDTFHLGSNDGVSSDRCGNFGDGDGVSRCWALVGGGWRNSSVRCRCSRDDWWGNGNGGLSGLGWGSNVSEGSGLADALLLGVGNTGLHTLSAHLDLTVTNHSMVGAGYWGTSVDMLLHSVANHGVTDGMVGKTSVGKSSMGESRMGHRDNMGAA